MDRELSKQLRIICWFIAITGAMAWVGSLIPAPQVRASVIVQPPPSGVHTMFIIPQVKNFNGGNPTINQCNANAPVGVTNGSFPAGTGMPGLEFSAIATGLIYCYVPLDNWDGATPFTVTFTAWVNTGAADGGTVIWQVASGCQTLTNANTLWVSLFNTAQPAPSYLSSTTYGYSRVSVSPLTTTGCVKGAGNVMTLAIGRATGTSANPADLSLIGVTGVF